VGLRDVIEGHHHQAEEQHGGNSADPIPVTGKDSVLIGRAGPTQQFERTEIGGNERQASDPGGHFAARHEKIFPGLREPF